MKMELMVLSILTALTFTSSSVVNLEPSVRVVPSQVVDDDLSGDASKLGSFHGGWGGSPGWSSSGGWGSSSGWSSCSTRTATHTQSLRSTSTVTTGTVSTYTSTLIVETSTVSKSKICAAQSFCGGARTDFYDNIEPTAVHERFVSHPPGTENEFDPNVYSMATAMYNTLKDYVEANHN